MDHQAMFQIATQDDLAVAGSPSATWDDEAPSSGMWYPPNNDQSDA